MVQLSAVLLTYNESANIADCIASVQTVADEIVVIDSFSTDDTVVIAQQLGATVVLHTFEDFIQQRRFAVSQCRYNHVLALDADERLSPELVQSIQAVKQHWQADAYKLNRLSSIADKWIRHGSWYPSWKVRLFDRRQVSFGGALPHDAIIPNTNTSVSKLKGDLRHYSDRDIAHRFQIVNTYSTIAAEEAYKRGKRSNWFRIIIKPWFRFISDYFFKKGFLDGFYGFVLAISTALYVFLREAKLYSQNKD